MTEGKNFEGFSGFSGHAVEIPIEGVSKEITDAMDEALGKVREKYGAQMFDVGVALDSMRRLAAALPDEIRSTFFDNLGDVSKALGPRFGPERLLSMLQTIKKITDAATAALEAKHPGAVMGMGNTKGVKSS